MAGGLRRWLGGSRGRNTSAPFVDDEDTAVLPDGVAEQIATVEAAALSIYEQYGLPTAAGCYIQRGPDAPWELLPASLTTREKWDLLEEAPPQGKWRFVERSAIGRLSEVTELQRASLLLAACAGLAARLEGKVPTTAQDVADALQLGAATSWLTQASGSSPLINDDTEAYTPLSFIPVLPSPDAPDT